MLSPYRNSEQDIADALEYAAGSFDDWPKEPRLDMKLGIWSLSKILNYDDYSSWGAWRSGELREAEDLEEELSSFRGSVWAAKAIRWTKDGVPAIVLIKSPYGVGIADGRGRVSFAVGMGLPSLHVIHIIGKK